MDDRYVGLKPARNVRPWRYYNLILADGGSGLLQPAASGDLSTVSGVMIAASAFVDVANAQRSASAQKTAPLELPLVGELVEEDQHSAARSAVPTVASAC